jgi:tRNA G18 (ribose-2'-O)-methylase SpoU
MNAVLIGVEFGGTNLQEFKHPKQAIYLLGAEDHGLPDDIISRCNQIISIESINMQSYNVSTAGSLVMYDRVFRREQS